MIPTATPENHAAVIAWVEGGMDPAQRQEFAAHLATCAMCQAEVAALQQRPAPRRSKVTGRTLFIAISAIVVLSAGFALGWWTWQLAHR